MTKEFESRFDIRVNASLKKQFQKVCKDNNLTLSYGARDALDIFIYFRPFVNALIENLQDPSFFDIFITFYNSMPSTVQKTFDDLFGPEEEKVVKETPPQLLKNIKVVTKKGNKALKKLL